MLAKCIGVMIVDDHELMREGLKQLLELESFIKIKAQAKNEKEAVDKALKYKPDIILLDINMPNMNGIDILKRYKDLGVKSKIIMLTRHEEKEYLYKSMKMGADGYLLKSCNSSKLVRTIKEVNNGETYIQSSLVPLLKVDKENENRKANEDLLKIKELTKREYEVLILIAEGLSNKSIGEELYISEKTVKNHISNIFKKLDVDDRMKAAIFAFKNNIKII